MEIDWENKEEVIKYIRERGVERFFYASNKLRKDKEVVMIAVSIDGSALQYASEELKNDKEVVMIAVKKANWALEYASEELKNDKEVVMTAVSQNGGALQCASEELKKDKEVVMTAVSKDGKAIEYASEELRNDKEIVMVAVSNKGWALEYASEELKNDKEVVRAAVSQYGMALEYASEELRNDKEVVRVAVSQNSTALEYASEEMRNDKEIVMAAVSQYGMVLEYASEELRNDKEVVIAALSEDGRALRYASEELRSDKEILLMAVRKSSIGEIAETISYINNDSVQEPELLMNFLEHINDCLCNYESFWENESGFEYYEMDVKKAMEICNKLFESKDKLLQNPEMYIRCLKEANRLLLNLNKFMDEDGYPLYEEESYHLGLYEADVSDLLEELAPIDIKDRELILTSVKVRPVIFRYLTEELRNDKEIAMIAIGELFVMLEYASEELKKDTDILALYANSKRTAYEIAEEIEPTVTGMSNVTEEMIDKTPNDLNLNDKQGNLNPHDEPGEEEPRV